MRYLIDNGFDFKKIIYNKEDTKLAFQIQKLKNK